jgi:hypothetical protein
MLWHVLIIASIHGHRNFLSQASSKPLTNTPNQEIKMKVGFFALMALVMIIEAQAAEFLGKTRLARHRDDRDLIHFVVPKCGISEVQLQVDVRPAEIDHVAVQFANGNWDYLAVRDRFARGSRSRWIDLRGPGERCLKKILIIGDSDGLPGRQSHISVYGR